MLFQFGNIIFFVLFYKIGDFERNIFIEVYVFYEGYENQLVRVYKEGFILYKRMFLK